MSTELAPMPVESPEEMPPTIKIAEQPIIVDRSTLEPYLECPLSARLTESLVTSVDSIATVGNEVHNAISTAIVSYVESYLQPGDTIGPRELKDIIETRTWESRADVQPDAVKSTRFSLYSLAGIIGNVSPQSILAFDGGDELYIPDREHIADATVSFNENEFEAVVGSANADLKPGLFISGYGIPDGTRIVKVDDETITLSNPVIVSRSKARVEFHKTTMRCLSGQLDYDFQFGRSIVRLTAEMDFLHSTKTPGLLRLYDWKSGWKSWTEQRVEDSFQFQVYAFLVLETYSDIDAVDVLIHDTRKNHTTMPCRFERSDVGRIRLRILSAIGDLLKNRNVPLENVEARPSREACRLCSAAALCTICDEDIREIAKDPVAAVDKLYAMKRSIEEREKTLKAICLTKDIITPSGNCFGYGRVKRSVKPKAELYTSKALDDSDE